MLYPSNQYLVPMHYTYNIRSNFYEKNLRFYFFLVLATLMRNLELHFQNLSIKRKFFMNF